MPEGAPQRAASLDRELEQKLDSLTLPSRRDIVAHLRIYLFKQNQDLDRKNNIDQILKIDKKRDETLVTLGPSFDKGPEDTHFYLPSKSRLSFGITLRESNGRSKVLAYRFQVNLPDMQHPIFYRFDLNSESHATPLHEPRCHFHPGMEHVRIPCPVLTPIEVLDRIFLVIDPQITQVDTASICSNS